MGLRNDQHSMRGAGLRWFAGRKSFSRAGENAEGECVGSFVARGVRGWEREARARGGEERW
jgi:hypothetical protein